MATLLYRRQGAPDFTTRAGGALQREQQRRSGVLGGERQCRLALAARAGPERTRTLHVAPIVSVRCEHVSELIRK